jgi:hypothetical protein
LGREIRAFQSVKRGSRLAGIIRAVRDMTDTLTADEAVITRLFSCETSECDEMMKRVFTSNSPESRAMMKRLLSKLFAYHIENTLKGVSMHDKVAYLKARAKYYAKKSEQQLKSVEHAIADWRKGVRWDDVVLRREEWDALLADDEDRPERTEDFVRELRDVLEPRDWGDETAKQRQERHRWLNRTERHRHVQRDSGPY